MNTNHVIGLHHITAIASHAKENLDFYTKVLGLRLVKKTVNFDDPGTYHFYYGNKSGEPGTILTFFPWEGISQGRNGTGLATHIGYSVAKGALAFWKQRLTQFNIPFETAEKFAEPYLSFTDPDGLQLQLIEPTDPDPRTGWTTEQIDAHQALKGFYSVTLTLDQAAPTARVLTDILDYQQQGQQGQTLRFKNQHIATAGTIDILEDPKGKGGYNAAGTNHHIAFRVKNEDILMQYREKVLAAGLKITPKIDRDYFFSLYFREPGGVLFELATDNPGFTTDEPLDALGSQLKLPKQYEGFRAQIEEALPRL
jgi:glyoxalase family protein